MSKLQTVLIALNENNFDALSNDSLNMIKGGTYCPPPPCGSFPGYGNGNGYGNGKSKKSNKNKFKKSKKSRKSNGNGSYPCGW